MSNWINVVLSAFGLSVLFFYAPAITVVAGLILVVYYHNQEISNVAGKVVGFVQLLALAFITAVVTQVLLTIVFGASFHTLVQNGGLVVALQNPAAISSAVTKEVLALVVVLCAVYLMVTATTPQRWLFKVAMVLSLLALAFQSWNVGTAGSQARHQMRLTLLVEEGLANIDARLKDFGLGLNRDTVFKEYRADMPTVYFASSDAYLYGKDGEEMTRGEAVVLGTKWFHVVNGEAVTDKSGIVYLPVVSFNDEKKTGWLRVDRMSKSEPSIPKIEALTPPMEPERKKVAVKPAEPEKVKPAVHSTVVEKPKSVKAITATTDGWISTGIVPVVGDVIRLGYFCDEENIGRLKIRLDGRIVEEVNPKGGSNNWFADVRVVTPNKSGSCLEVGLKNGDPIEVGVVKL